MFHPRFLLLCGVSGVGKTTIIQRLLKLDDRFVYISPDTTRPLRLGETGKNFVTDQEMDRHIFQDKYLTVNNLYNGIRYATPKMKIYQSLNEGKFPVLDWPIAKIYFLKKRFPHVLYTVYLSPPSISVLIGRLSKDGRDPDGNRIKAAKEELRNVEAGMYNTYIDLHIVNINDRVETISAQIYDLFVVALYHEAC